MQWLRDANQSNADNLNNGTSEASKQFRKESREYQKGKINELETNNKKNITDLYRDINEFKKGCQPRTNIVKDVNDDLVAASHSILNRWKNYLSQLLNVHRVNNVRKIEIHSAKPLVPQPSASEVEMSI
jgi:hypothetical protein